MKYYTIILFLINSPLLIFSQRSAYDFSPDTMLFNLHLNIEYDTAKPVIHSPYKVEFKDCFVEIDSNQSLDFIGLEARRDGVIKIAFNNDFKWSDGLYDTLPHFIKVIWTLKADPEWAKMILFIGNTFTRYSVGDFYFEKGKFYLYEKKKETFKYTKESFYKNTNNSGNLNVYLNNDLVQVFSKNETSSDFYLNEENLILPYKRLTCYLSFIDSNAMHLIWKNNEKGELISNQNHKIDAKHLILENDSIIKLFCDYSNKLGFQNPYSSVFEISYKGKLYTSVNIKKDNLHTFYLELKLSSKEIYRDLNHYTNKDYKEMVIGKRKIMAIEVK